MGEVKTRSGKRGRGNVPGIDKGASPIFSLREKNFCSRTGAPLWSGEEGKAAREPISYSTKRKQPHLRGEDSKGNRVAVCKTKIVPKKTHRQVEIGIRSFNYFAKALTHLNRHESQERWREDQSRSNNFGHRKSLGEQFKNMGGCNI